jgi:membrane protein DedA with SNARE-associated domain
MDTITHLVSQWGYPGIFAMLVLGIVGLPIPDETLLTFVGYLAYKGELGLLPSVLTVFTGSICGITLSYVLGRTLGLTILHKYGRYFHITAERLERTHRWFDRSGHWLLVIGYFIPGVRHVTAYVAGASELELGHFMTFAYAGGLIWSVGFVMLGYSLGEKWEMVIHAIHHNVFRASIIAAVLAAIYFGWKYWRKKKNAPAAQAIEAVADPGEEKPAP